MAKRHRKGGSKKLKVHGAHLGAKHKMHKGGRRKRGHKRA